MLEIDQQDKIFKLRLVQTCHEKRINLGCLLRMGKVQPDRKDPIYCSLHSELCRSERGFIFQPNMVEQPCLRTLQIVFLLFCRATIF